MTTDSTNHPLRRFVRKPRAEEECELCAKAVGSAHRHLLEPATRKILCACEPCALLFSSTEAARYRRVPTDVRYLGDFVLTDALWQQMMIPIDLAFFYDSTPDGRVVAFYPSPAGPTESLLPIDAWETLTASNDRLRAMQPDVEALLVDRIRKPGRVFLVPIDECFRLVGLIRMTWRGLSGGTEAWTAINGFFDGLQGRAIGSRGSARV